VKKKDLEENEIKKNTLFDFIEQNHKIISVLGVFIALTVFTANLSFQAIGYALSFLFMAITIIVWMELLERFPKGESTWRFKTFENLLNYSFFGIIFYWLISYREIWKNIMFIPLTIILAAMLTSLLTLPIKKYDLFDRVFRTKPGKLKVIRYILFLLILFIVLHISFWIAFIISPPINYFFDQLHNEMIKWIPQNKP